MVYKLYELTYEEVKIVGSTFGTSEDLPNSSKADQMKEDLQHEPLRPVE